MTTTNVSANANGRTAPRGKGGRPATGTVTYVPADPKKGETQGHYRVRITLLDGSRPWISCDPGPKSPKAEARAREKAAAWTERAREKKLTPNDFATMKTTTSATTTPTKAPAGETVSAWFERWVAERIAKGNKSTGDDRSRFRTHVEPTFGAMAIRAVTKRDVETFVQRLDDRVRADELSWKTATHAWGVLSMMFHDAAYSKRLALRVREDDPTDRVEGPDRGTKRSKVYLYPNEFLALVSCKQVPLAWRRFFAVSVYMYARAGEVKALTWADTDLDVGVAHIHESVDRNTGESTTTKTASGTRKVPIEKALVPLLSAMKEEQGGKGRLFAWAATDRKLSRQLQRCMQLAGLTREDLFANDAARKALTFHDLRATGITWCAVRGDDALKVKQRAGHATFSTTEGYIREAENLGETNFGTPFPPLPACLLSNDEDDPTPDDDGEDALEGCQGAQDGNDDSHPSEAGKASRIVRSSVPGFVPSPTFGHLGEQSDASADGDTFTLPPKGSDGANQGDFDSRRLHHVRGCFASPPTAWSSGLPVLRPLRGLRTGKRDSRRLLHHGTSGNTRSGCLWWSVARP